MSKDITKELEAAKILIRQVLGSQQATPEHAVRHAIRMINLPNSLYPQLLEWSKNYGQS